MKKIIAVILLAFSLSGCLFQVANSLDIERAVYFCGKVENIAEITLFAGGREVIDCKDGRWIAGHSVVIKR